MRRLSRKQVIGFILFISLWASVGFMWYDVDIAARNGKFAGSLATRRLNGVLWVGQEGTDEYPSLASCYAALPATGGTCMVSPNYSETLKANLMLDKNDAGFVFTGPFSIIMGTNQIIVPSPTQGAFIVATVPYGGLTGDPPTGGGSFFYSGLDKAFQIGDDSANTGRIALKGFSVNMVNAAGPAIGIYIYHTTNVAVDGVAVIGPAGTNNTMIGWQITDGGSGDNFSGDSVFRDIASFGVQTGILVNGQAQENTFLGLNLATGSPSPANSIGVDLEGTVFTNVFTGGVVSGFTTGMKFGSGVTNNRMQFGVTEPFTTSVAFAAGSSHNFADILSLNPVVTDAGVHNGHRD